MVRLIAWHRGIGDTVHRYETRTRARNYHRTSKSRESRHNPSQSIAHRFSRSPIGQAVYSRILRRVDRELGVSVDTTIWRSGLRGMRIAYKMRDANPTAGNGQDAL